MSQRCWCLNCWVGRRIVNVLAAVDICTQCMQNVYVESTRSSPSRTCVLTEHTVDTMNKREQCKMFFERRRKRNWSSTHYITRRARRRRRMRRRLLLLENCRRLSHGSARSSAPDLIRDDDNDDVVRQTNDDESRLRRRRNTSLAEWARRRRSRLQCRRGTCRPFQSSTSTTSSDVVDGRQLWCLPCARTLPSVGYCRHHVQQDDCSNTAYKTLDCCSETAWCYAIATWKQFMNDSTAHKCHL